MKRTAFPVRDLGLKARVMTRLRSLSRSGGL
jgi:hypothetical protein